MSAKLYCLGLAAAVVLLAGVNQANAQAYAFTDLGAPIGGPNSTARAINNAGQVAGWADTTHLSDRPDPQLAPHAVVWNGTTATDLGTLGGTSSWA